MGSKSFDYKANVMKDGVEQDDLTKNDVKLLCH